MIYRNRLLIEKVFIVHYEVDTQILNGLKKISLSSNIISKNDDDGSEVLDTYLKRRKLKNIRLFICGMNTSACILETALSLKGLGYKPAVVGDACWTVYGQKKHTDSLYQLRGADIPVFDTLSTIFFLRS